jgi:hypothetical protein
LITGPIRIDDRQTLSAKMEDLKDEKTEEKVKIDRLFSGG